MIGNLEFLVLRSLSHNNQNEYAIFYFIKCNQIDMWTFLNSVTISPIAVCFGPHGVRQKVAVLPRKLFDNHQKTQEKKKPEAYSCQFCNNNLVLDFAWSERDWGKFCRVI